MTPSRFALWSCFLASPFAPPYSPQAQTPSAPYAAVSNEGSNNISILARDGKQLFTIPVPNRPRGIAFSADGRRLFVALSDDRPNAEGSGDAIVEIDVSRRRIVRRIAAGSDPETFAITPNDRRLYSSNEDAGTASATDLRSGRVVATMVVGIEPEGVAASPDGRWIYVTAETSNSVSLIDALTNRVVANVLVDARPRAAVFTPDGKLALVTAEIGGTLAIIDVATRAVVGAVTLQGGRGKPVGVAVSPDSRFAFVANGGTHSVSVVDLDRRQEVAQIPVGRRPWGIAMSRDGKTLYTANGVSNDVSIIDVASRRVRSTTRVGTRPWGVALVR
jgi:PQQ-dependent catabolism-associated beta-propeller protein